MARPELPEAWMSALALAALRLRQPREPQRVVFVRTEDDEVPEGSFVFTLRIDKANPTPTELDD